MKEYYVITDLIQNEELNEVNVLGLTKSEQEAKEFLNQKLQDVIEMYEEEVIKYNITRSEQNVIVTTSDSTITIEYQEGEVI